MEKKEVKKLKMNFRDISLQLVFSYIYHLYIYYYYYQLLFNALTSSSMSRKRRQIDSEESHHPSDDASQNYSNQEELKQHQKKQQIKERIYKRNEILRLTQSQRNAISRRNTLAKDELNRNQNLKIKDENQERGQKILDPQNGSQYDHPDRYSRTRRTNIVKRNYQQDFSDNQNGMDEENQKQSSDEYIYFRGGRVIKVLAEREREDTGEVQKLCKFYSRSYLHLQWLTERDCRQRQIQMIRQTKRSIQAAQTKLNQIKQKYGNEHFFNPSFVKVDRILTTAVLFPVMHHKKGSEMNGKWSQLMMLVCSKILNFQKNHIPYGVIQKDDYHPEEGSLNKMQNKTKIQHVINRVYLDKYKSPEQFWNDVGESIKSLNKLFSQTGRQQDAEILRQCIVFLYWQWFYLEKQKFLAFLPKTQTYQKIRSDLQKQACLISLNFPLSIQNEDPKFKFQSLLNENIFIKNNYAELPTTQKQLLLLHPGRFSYNWLYDSKNPSDTFYSKFNPQSQKPIEFKFQYLNINDMKKLDLNVEIDPLYLIKWCDLDYDQVTWEKQSDLNCIQKIQNFKQYSKIPPKKDRARIQQNKKYHRSILGHLLGEKLKQKPEEIDRFRRKLYHYTYSASEPKQYGAEDTPVYKGYKILKPFQLQGLNWLIKSWHERRNVILADEMGLGKTIQTIAFLNHLHVFEDVLGPFLVVAPVSTLKQWRNQIQGWSDLNCVLYKGKNNVRDLIQEYQFYHKFVTNEGIFVKYQKLPRFQVLLTNYQIFQSDIEILQKIAFQFIILDEAHKVKNSNSKIAHQLKKLPCPRLLLLTGTPIQNNTTQIFGLLNVVEPKKFNSLQLFKQKFGSLKTVQQLTELKEVLKPYLMRRVKSDVEKSIPKLSQMLVKLQLTKIQKAYYKGILQKNKNELLRSLNSVAINNISLCQRQCCDHPYLLDEQVQQQITSKCKTEQQKFDTFINSSSKMIFVHKFLTKCRQKSNRTKTLIFSQFLQMIQLIKKYCMEMKIQFQLLDGSVNYQERQNRIDRFNNNPDVLVFIISTKAGGIGINLTSATNIIIYDSDWNPQNDIQAIARAHRIGQHKSVSVYRLITTQTYQDILYQTAVKKLGIGLAILDNEYFNNQIATGNNPVPAKKEKSREEIEKLLRDGVLGFLKSQENSNKDGSNSIQNQSIQQIISKSCTAVDYQTKDCSFTSTKFELDNNEKNLSINDPNFWEVALQNVQSPLQKLVNKMKNEKQAKKIFENLEQQLKIMIQANDIVYNLVKSKVSMSHFNAQDQRQLRAFLQKITYSRQFHKQFKSIANDWLQQIEKPSRRFEKHDVNKLMEIAKITPKIEPTRLSRNRSKKMDQQKNQMSQQEKKVLNSKNQIKKKASMQQSQQDQEPEQAQEPEPKKATRAISRKLKTQAGQQGDGQHYKPRPLLPSSPQQYTKQITQFLGYYLQKLCIYCQRKICSRICKNRCKRAFHSFCYQRYRNGDQLVPNLDELEQGKMSKDDLKQKLIDGFQCDQCIDGDGKCFVCGEIGRAITSAWVDKGPPKKSKLSKNVSSRNQIDQIYEASSEQERKFVYQCRMQYCTKVYHLKCLKQLKKQMEFELFANKQQQSYPLKCPCHFCHSCQKKMTIMKTSCVRCPISYHIKCKNKVLDTIQQIEYEWFRCKVHGTSEENGKWQQKKNKMQQKKTDKLLNKILTSQRQEDKQTYNFNKQVSDKIENVFKQKQISNEKQTVQNKQRQKEKQEND